MRQPATLGEFLAFNRRSSAELRTWLEGQDPALIERLAKEADVRGETIAHFLRIATADFMAEADEETWASLISALRDGADPGAACVVRVMDFRVRLEQPRQRS